MDTRTGQIIDYSEVAKLPARERRHYVEVKRDLSAKERMEKQIGLYAPCGCGSGKKFKFCCKEKRAAPARKEAMSL